jgi:tetratricopeptide (TPR) repeat protein
MRNRFVAAVFAALLLASQFALAHAPRWPAPQPAWFGSAQEDPATPQTQRQKDELRAKILMATKRYREAVDAYTKLATQYPRDATYPNFVGIARMQLGEMDGAARSFTRATKINGKFADAFNNLGTVWFAQKNYQKALRQYQKAISIQPRVAGYYTNVGYAYFAEKRMPQAMDAFHKALSIDPQVFEQNSRNGSVMQQQDINNRGLFDFMLAKGYAQNGNGTQCAVYLRKAFDEGYQDVVKVRSDPAFAAVLTDPDVKDLLDRIAPEAAQAPATPPGG